MSGAAAPASTPPGRRNTKERPPPASMSDPPPPQTRRQKKARSPSSPPRTGPPADLHPALHHTSRRHSSRPEQQPTPSSHGPPDPSQAQIGPGKSGGAATRFERPPLPTIQGCTPPMRTIAAAPGALARAEGRPVARASSAGSKLSSLEKKTRRRHLHRDTHRLRRRPSGSGDAGRGVGEALPAAAARSPPCRQRRATRGTGVFLDDIKKHY